MPTDIQNQIDRLEFELCKIDIRYQAGIYEGMESTYEQMKFDARVEATEPFVNWREKTQKITTDYEIHLKSCILAEREACAKVCDEFGEWRDTSGVDCAAAIRARSN